MSGMAAAGPLDAWRAREAARARRRADEAERIARVRLVGDRPVGAAPDVPEGAAGRGAMVPEVPRETVMTANGPRVVRSDPQGHCRLRRLDVFDLMTVQAKRRQAAPPCTAAQVEAGREYARLAERLAASGLSLSAWERTGGGGTGGVSEAVLADGARMGRMHRAIGPALALPLRRVRPSARGPEGTARASITDRALVDGVCLAQLTVAQVLGRHGWTVDSHTRKEGVRALRDVLDRLWGL